MDTKLSPPPSQARNLDRFGPRLDPDGCTFRLWAPWCGKVRLEIDGRVLDGAMRRGADGFHALKVPGAGPGTRYRFVLEDGTRVPDPASRHQPDGVHGPSEVIDPDGYRWQTPDWRGRPWHEMVFYQLHVGTFTPAGTYVSAIERLDHVAALGATAIQLLPLHAFPGRWGWSYDGVLLYAPAEQYGRPEDLKALVDAAHARGLGVFADVVYNHFGPEANYLHRYAPMQSPEHQTDYGAAPNVDDPDHSAEVRDFLIGNAVYWLEEYRLDGLRIDAAHAIRDNGPTHVLDELADCVHQRVTGRQVHLVVENADNEARWLERRPDGRPVWYTAQWQDDLHHALHVAISGEQSGFYGDYDGSPQEVGRALAEGFFFQGQPGPDGKPKGSPSGHLPPTAFVAFVQNHDQTGNRPRGHRIHQIVGYERTRAFAAAILLSPHIPLVFMGEEWAATSPFPYFCDVGGDVRDSILQSRREQLKSWPEVAGGAAMADPFDIETVRSSRLDWDEPRLAPHAEMLAHYRRLLEIRRRVIQPLLPQARGNASWRVLGHALVEVTWPLGERRLTMRVNTDLATMAPPADGEVVHVEGDVRNGLHGPWSVEVRLA